MVHPYNGIVGLPFEHICNENEYPLQLYRFLFVCLFLFLFVCLFFENETVLEIFRNKYKHKYEHLAFARGGHLYFRLDIFLVKGLSKHTLNTYLSSMKIDPRYVLLHVFFLICPLCPFKNLSIWPKTQLPP